MVAKTWYMTNNLAGTAHQEMSETDPGTEANASPQTGWVVGTGATLHSPLDAQSNQASGTFTATTDPDGTPTTTAGAGDCLRSTNQYSGTFAAANWTASFCFRGVTQAGTQDGRVRFRLLRGSDPTGSGATEITAAQQQASLVTNLLTTPTQTSSLTFSPGAFTVNNEYIFIQIAWERTGAGGMTTTDVAFRIGNASGAGTRIVSADFTPTPPRTDPPDKTGLLTQPGFHLRRFGAKSLALLAAAGPSLLPAPPPEVPVEEGPAFVSAATGITAPLRRTLYYQANIRPPDRPLQPLEGTTFSTTTGVVRSKTLFYQSKIYGIAPPVVVVVDDVDWLVPLSRAPSRLPTETALYTPFVPSVAPQPTADEWLQPFRRQVAALLPYHTQPVLAYTPVEVVADVTPAQWLPRWRGPPTLLPAPAGGSPFVPKEAVLDNTVTPDVWMPRWQGPPSYHPAQAGGSPFVPKEAVRENTVTPDAWMVPLSRAVPIPRVAQPTQPFLGYPQEAVDNSRFEWDWSIAWQGPPRYVPPRIAAQPFVPREAVLDNTVTPDAWMPSWRGPPRYLQQLAAGIVYPPQGVVEVNTRTEWDWQISWQGPPRYLLELPGGSPFVPKEAVLENTQTPDKWLKPLGTVPPRYVPPKILAQPFVPREAVLENTQTPDKWLIKWQGPPNYNPAPAGGSPFIPKEAVLENTVTVEKWVVRFSKAVPVPKPVLSQPVLGYPYESQAIVVPYEQWWHQPLSRAAQRPQVHAKPYQPFVPKEAVLENTQTPDKWLQRFGKAIPIAWPRYAPVTVPYYPYESVVADVGPDKWLRAFSRPVPVRGTSYAPVIVPYPPYVAPVVLDVTVAQWLRPFTKATQRAWIRDTNRQLPSSSVAIPAPYFSVQHTTVNFTRVLYAKSTFEGRVPPPVLDPPVGTVAFAVTSAAARRKTLHYQARIGLEWSPPALVQPPAYGATSITTAASFRRRTLYYQAWAFGYPYQGVEPPIEQHVTVGITVAFGRMLRYSCKAEADGSYSEEAEQSDPWATQDEVAVNFVDETEQADPWSTQDETADTADEEDQEPQSGCE